MSMDEMRNSEKDDIVKWLETTFNMIFSGGPEAICVIAQCENGDAYFADFAAQEDKLAFLEKCAALCNRQIIKEVSEEE